MVLLAVPLAVPAAQCRGCEMFDCLSMGRAAVTACAFAAALLLGLFYQAVALAPASGPAVSFISPRVKIQTAPAEVPIQLRVERHADNRWLEVYWDAAPCESGDLFPCEEHGVCEAGSLLIQMEGIESPVILPREPRWIRIGTRCPYQFEAELKDKRGKVRGRAKTKLWIR